MRLYGVAGGIECLMEELNEGPLFDWPLWCPDDDISELQTETGEDPLSDCGVVAWIEIEW